jgi:hypothetical protein
VPATAFVRTGVGFDLPVVGLEAEGFECRILGADSFGPDGGDGDLAGECFEEGPGGHGGKDKV